MMTATTDRIEKQVVLHASRTRVWRALTDFREFSDWFQTRFDQPFMPGARLHGRVTQPGYEPLQSEIVIERMVPEHLFSFRWYADGIEPGRGYSKEPMTLVEFLLEEVEGDTVLGLTESGLDQLPVQGRAHRIQEHERAWDEQMRAVEGYLRNNP